MPDPHGTSRRSAWAGRAGMPDLLSCVTLTPGATRLILLRMTSPLRSITVHGAAALLLALLVSPTRAADIRLASFARLRGAAADLKPGDVVTIAAGEHPGGVSIWDLKGTKKAPITIRGEAGTRIVGSRRDAFQLTDCAWVMIEDLTVQGAERAGIIIHASTHIVVRNCRVIDNARWGVKTAMCDHITVEDSTISGATREHGIYFSTTDHPVVRRCTITDNMACGIHMNGDISEGGDGMITGGVIVDNVILAKGRRGGAGINMDSAEKTVIQRNLLHGNKGGGITSFTIDGAHAGSGNIIQNNTVIFHPGDGRYAVQLINGTRDSVVQGNILVCGRGPALEFDEASLKGLKSDQNILFVHNNHRVVRISDNWMDLDAWRKRFKQDRNSVAMPVLSTGER